MMFKMHKLILIGDLFLCDDFAFEICHIDFGRVISRVREWVSERERERERERATVGMEESKTKHGKEE